MDESSTCFQKIQVASSNRFEHGNTMQLYFRFSEWSFGGNSLCLPHAQLTVTASPGRWFQSLTDIIPTSGNNQILTWFIILTVTRAQPPSIPCDVSYLSGVTLPPRWVSPSSWRNVINFSRPFLKGTHFAGGDRTVVLYNDTQNHVKSDTQHVPAHLKL